jgi:hypothetical protein
MLISVIDYLEEERIYKVDTNDLNIMIACNLSLEVTHS